MSDTTFTPPMPADAGRDRLTVDQVRARVLRRGQSPDGSEAPQQERHRQSETGHDHGRSHEPEYAPRRDYGHAAAEHEEPAYEQSYEPSHDEDYASPRAPRSSRGRVGYVSPDHGADYYPEPGEDYWDSHAQRPRSERQSTPRRDAQHYGETAAHTPAQGGARPAQRPSAHDRQHDAEAAPAAIPTDFGYENEHPILNIPFTLHMQGRSFTGKSLSLTHLVIQNDGGAALESGTREIALLHFSFESFGMSLQPEVRVLDRNPDGTTVLQFTQPTGDHLPQLRYIINNYIAGDMVTLNGVLSYTGPTKPKAAKKDDEGTKGRRRRSLGVLTLSAILALSAGYLVFSRYTTGTEMQTVFVQRAGQQMRATTAGQISYLNPNAAAGEVAYSINSNSGDVLNFRMPCDCEVTVPPGISEGTTVLPVDLILTVFGNTSEIQVQTLMSIEGFRRAMRGDNVYLDLDDGRTIPVTVVPGAATSDAALRGEDYVPVELRPEAGALDDADIGKTASLRLTANLLSRTGLQ